MAASGLSRPLLSLPSTSAQARACLPNAKRFVVKPSSSLLMRGRTLPLLFLAACSGSTPDESPTSAPSPEPTETLVPVETPPVTPTATVKPEPTPTFAPTPTPGPFPECRSVAGDAGGLVIGLEAGARLINNVTPLTTLGYTWDLALSADGRWVYESFMGALYRSEDAGCTFRQVRNLPSNRFKALLLDPANRQRLLMYAYDNPELVSTDDGETFTLSTVSWEGETPTGVVSMSLDPLDALHVRAVTAEGRLIHSRDGGATWEPLGEKNGYLSTPIVTMAAFNPDDPTEVVLATGFDGLIKGSSDGATWTRLEEGLRSPDTPAETPLVGVFVAYSPADPSVLYTVVSDPDREPSRGLFYSDDAGLRFTELLRDDEQGVALTGGTRLFPDPVQPYQLYTWFGTYFQDVYTDLYRLEVEGASVTVNTQRFSFPDLYGFAFHPLDETLLYLGRVNDAPN